MAASGNVRYSQLRSGDRSGTGAKVATVTGTLTADKQLKFDSSGNIVASSSDIGGGSGIGGAGTVLLATQTASSSAQLDFTSLITSTYDEYQFEFLNLIPATNGVDFYMRMSTDNGSTFDSSAVYSRVHFAIILSASNRLGGTGETELRLADGATVANTSGMGICGWLKLYSPLSTSLYKRMMGQVTIYGTFANPREHMIVSGGWESLSAADAVRFYFSSGNISSGIIRMYGIAK